MPFDFALQASKINGPSPCLSLFPKGEKIKAGQRAKTRCPSPHPDTPPHER